MRKRVSAATRPRPKRPDDSRHICRSRETRPTEGRVFSFSGQMGWCGRGDSNPPGTKAPRILSPLCLPIPNHARIGGALASPSRRPWQSRQSRPRTGKGAARSRRRQAGRFHSVSTRWADGQGERRPAYCVRSRHHPGPRGNDGPRRADPLDREERSHATAKQRTRFTVSPPTFDRTAFARPDAALTAPMPRSDPGLADGAVRGGPPRSGC